jgi:hypothetical protein
MEYTFFNQHLRARFIEFAAEQGLVCRTRDDTMEGSVIELPDDMDDEQMSVLEETYEALMDEQMLLAGDEEGWVTHRVMGITINRADGSVQAVRLHGDVARRLAEHFTPAEIHELVQAIAQNIENPIPGPVCRKA